MTSATQADTAVFPAAFLMLLATSSDTLIVMRLIDIS